MEQELKFRVWDNVNKNFNHSSRHFIDTDGLLFTDCDPTGIQMNGTRKIFCKPKQYTLAGQYTNQKDNEGIPIFVGDILSDKWLVEVYQNDEGTYMVRFHNNPKYNKQKSLINYLKSRNIAGTHDRDNVIIGNIYENPELLIENV